jgi:hypothetical protein
MEDRMPTTRKLHLVVLCAVLTVVAYGQEEQNQPDKAAGTIGKDKVADATSKAREDTPESIYFVEQLAQAKAVQAVPMLEAKFEHTRDGVDKAHIASALVRLGDKNDIYWDFLVKQATTAVESDAPDFMSYDSHGKSVPGPSPEFVAWAKAHNLSPATAGDDSMYRVPGAVGLLGLTGDPRAIPLLRRGLLSPNHQIEIVAAMGLAEIQDKDSIPFIIEACKMAPAAVATVMARSLVYFDDPQAQSAVDAYIPKEVAKTLREAKAQGKKTPWGY